MKRMLLQVSALLTTTLLEGTVVAQDAPPQIELTAGTTTLVVMLPDADRGFYTDTRFDWSGIIVFAECDGHTYIGGKTVGADGLAARDYSLGTSEEFTRTFYFNKDAKPSEIDSAIEAIRIGVGILKKTTQQDGRTPSVRFVLDRPFGWRIDHERHSIRFEQKVDHRSGFGYRYLKQITLADDGRSFFIDHRLLNTGVVPLQTMHYCHNWLRIDSTPGGRDYTIRFRSPPVITTDNGKFGGGLVDDRCFTFDRAVTKKGPYFAEVGGLTKPDDHWARVTNHKTGAALVLSGDWAPPKYHLYVWHNEVCPEPFIELELAAGQEQRWMSRYGFEARDLHEKNDSP